MGDLVEALLPFMKNCSCIDEAYLTITNTSLFRNQTIKTKQFGVKSKEGLKKLHVEIESMVHGFSLLSSLL